MGGARLAGGEDIGGINLHINTAVVSASIAQKQEPCLCRALAGAPPPTKEVALYLVLSPHYSVCTPGNKTI